MKRSIRAGMASLGVLGLLIGLCIILLGIFYLRPKAHEAMIGLDRHLFRVEGALEILGKHTPLLESVANLGESSGEMARLIPETLISTRGVLVQSALALETTATTLDSLEGGITGIVLPKTEVGHNVASVRKSADQLRQLAALMMEMRPISQRIATDSSIITTHLRQLRRSFPDPQTLIADLKSQVQNTRRNLSRLPTSAGVIGITAFCGGIYCFLGLLCLLGVALFDRLDQPSELNSLKKWISTLPKKAA